MMIQEEIPYTEEEVKAIIRQNEELRKKYNNALEKARELMDKGYYVLMPEIFPELQESKEEKASLDDKLYVQDKHGTFVEMDGERHYVDDNPDWNELIRPPHPLPWTPERADHDIIWNNEPDIDWEQRRYEIAREMYVHFPSMSVEAAVNHANMLIEELKKFAKE